MPVIGLAELDGLSFSLLAAAAGVGVIHTLLGPDHYLPFVMLARARQWSWARTFVTVTICGVGHVLGSLLLGAVGLALGSAIGQIEALEAARGDWAAWCTVAFGFAYAAWGLRAALRRGSDLAPHAHGTDIHIHTHGSRAHAHAGAKPGGFTFWALLSIFVLGPCEPLVPLFVIPASRGRWELALATLGVFAVATVVTMWAATAAGLAGIRRLRGSGIERWGHALAGVAVASSGVAILSLGL